MGFLDLFVTNPDEAPKKVEKKEAAPVATPVSFPKESTGFPSSTPAFTPSPAPIASVNTYMEEVMKVYASGFDGLNKEGVDFYELFKAVESAGLNNPAAYKMALTMLQNVDKNFSKEKALADAQYYIDNILKAYQEFLNNGIAKKQKLETDKGTEASSLTSEVSQLESQIKTLQDSLAEKKMLLGTIDSKYEGQLAAVEGKLQANEVAKETILGQIKTVVENIKTNL